jgi:hypothetical protein
VITLSSFPHTAVCQFTEPRCSLEQYAEHLLADQVSILCRTTSSYLRHRKHTSPGTRLLFCPVDVGVKLNVAPPHTHTQSKGKDILVKCRDSKQAAWRHSLDLSNRWRLVVSAKSRPPTPGKDPRCPLYRSRVGPTASLSDYGEEKSSWPHRMSNPEQSIDSLFRLRSSVLAYIQYRGHLCGQPYINAAHSRDACRTVGWTLGLCVSVNKLRFVLEFAS